MACRLWSSAREGTWPFACETTLRRTTPQTKAERGGGYLSLQVQAIKSEQIIFMRNHAPIMHLIARTLSEQVRAIKSEQIISTRNHARASQHPSLEKKKAFLSVHRRVVECSRPFH